MGAASNARLRVSVRPSTPIVVISSQPSQ